MRSYLSLLSLLALAALVPATAARAQVAAPAAAATNAAFQAPTTNDTSLLWRIGGDDTEAPSYLFGTIHLIPAEDYFLENSVVRSLNDVDAVLFEIDPRKMQDPTAMLGLMGKIQMRNDTTLQDLLPASRYDSIETYFTEIGLPFFFFRNLKPMFLSAMVGQDMSAGNPFSGGAGKPGNMKNYEMELFNLAEAGNKEVGGLETMDFQIGLFDSIPYTVQAEMLYQSVADDMNKELGDGNSQLDQMVTMYQKKAIAEMSQLITSESEGYGNFEELLVIRRNQNWVPQIMERLRQTPTLYAVGAGHLGGENGVIALLRAEGISVEPVYE